jgi:hypothetical protein
MRIEYLPANELKITGFLDFVHDQEYLMQLKFG